MNMTNISFREMKNVYFILALHIMKYLRLYTSLNEIFVIMFIQKTWIFSVHSPLKDCQKLTGFPARMSMKSPDGIYSKTCLRRPLKNRQNKDLNNNL